MDKLDIGIIILIQFILYFTFSNVFNIKLYIVYESIYFICSIISFYYFIVIGCIELIGGRKFKLFENKKGK